MELLYYPYLLLSFLLLLLLLFLKAKSSTRKLNTKLPPGPPKLPIIGSLHHILGPLPHRRLHDLSRTYGPLMHLKLGEVNTVVASSPEAAREIMKTHDIAFATRPLYITVNIMSYNGKDIIFSPYGEHWRELRKLCILELLSAKRVHSFQSIREEEVLRLVRDSLSSGAAPAPAVNLTERLFMLANDITMRAVVGDKFHNQGSLLQAITEAVQAFGGFSLADIYPSSTLVSMFSGTVVKMRRAHRKLDAILDGLIQERMQWRMTDEGRQERDLLDVLLRLQEEGSLRFPLTTVIIKAIVLDLFGAGSDTSAAVLEWAMSELVRNPRVMKKAQQEVRRVVGARGRVAEADIAELGYLNQVIKETLRLHPPGPLLVPRECQETSEVLGHVIPAKTRVWVNAWSIGRDPRHWEEAEEFRPERFDGSAVDYKGASFELIPFGAGRRICPGMAFGTATVELALASLLYHYDWELPGGAEPSELDMAETFGMVVRRKSPLSLHAVPRFPCLGA